MFFFHKENKKEEIFLKRKISTMLIYFQFSFMEIKYRSEYSTCSHYLSFTCSSHRQVICTFLIITWKAHHLYLKMIFFKFFLVIMIFKTFTQMFKILTFFQKNIFLIVWHHVLQLYIEMLNFFVYFVFYVFLVSCISIDNF